MSTLDTVAILERLVAFPTVSRDSNLALIDWIRNFLKDCGVESHLVPDLTGRKSNLFASIGPSESGGLVLSGHTDVVPIDGQGWSSDPFTLTAAGSRLHGRGACDMKGFIAAALSRVGAWKASRLSRPVHLMLSYDEEVGCLGAPSLIAAAREVLPPPAAVIVGEPTGMRVANTHKGICTLNTRVTGIEAHSSLTHQGLSAVMLAADLIEHLHLVARDFAARVDERGRCFEPPYTSLSVNRIQGGTAINILAAICEFGWDIRTLPHDRAESILDELESYANALLTRLAQEGKPCSIETKVTAEVPPLEADGSEAERLALLASQVALAPTSVPFATEAGQYQRAGWSTVVCGPGSIEQAHKPDEFIELAELVACEGFLDRLVEHQCRHVAS